MTINDFVKGLLTKNNIMPTQNMIEAVEEKYPDSMFNKQHAAFYRGKFRREGMDIPLLKTPKSDTQSKGSKNVEKKRIKKSSRPKSKK